MTFDCLTSDHTTLVVAETCVNSITKQKDFSESLWKYRDGFVYNPEVDCEMPFRSDPGDF